LKIPSGLLWGVLLAQGLLAQGGGPTGVALPRGLSASDWAAIQAAFSSSTIAEQAYLKASNTGAGDRFGYAVSLSGDTVVVGANREDSNASGVNGDQSDDSTQDSGAAYIFVRDGASWTQQAYLKASNPGQGDNFAYGVSISGDTVVIGARKESSGASGVNGDESDNSMPGAGAAYVFVRSGTTWTQQAYLKASNPDSDDRFGLRVGIDGNTIVVGSWREASAATGVNGDQNNNTAFEAGAAYVFIREGTTWSQQAYLKASNTGAGDDYGLSVAVSGDIVVVGARDEASDATGVNGDPGDNSLLDAGAAYVYLRSGTTWTQEAYLKASNTGAGDHYGHTVDVSGTTVVVGAYLEDSSATGVDGNQSSNDATDAGAAYVYLREHGVWSQQAYLKASNAGATDRFSLRLGIDGDILAVGAYQERSVATGVNGNQADDSAPEAGAAYVFQRDGTTWTQLAYLKGSNNEAGDNFGRPVVVSGDTLIIGAYPEDGGAVGVNGDGSDNSAFAAGAAYIFDLASWQDLGGGTTGISGPPTLRVSGLLDAGSDLDIGLSRAPASALMLFRASLSSTPVAAVGGTIYANPFDLQLILAADPGGQFDLSTVVAPGGVPGVDIYFQFIVQDLSVPDKITLSNAMMATTP
jgi:hypothetical protein